MSHLVVVLAMHRSGSSLIARSLQCLGANLGKAAEWSGPDNPTGFWEHKGVLAVNEHILKVCEARWDSPPDEARLMEACRTSPDLTYLRGAAEHMLRRELEQHPTFAIKDPRLCVLLPFWKPVLAGLGCDVSVVRVVRHPEAVAASLRRRDGMDQEAALRLWLRYIQDAQNIVWPSVVIDYDAMMADPVLQLCRIGSRLGLTLDLTAGTRFATEFVDASEYHEAEECALPTEVGIVWYQVSREATNP